MKTTPRVSHSQRSRPGMRINADSPDAGLGSQGAAWVSCASRPLDGWSHGRFDFRQRIGAALANRRVTRILADTRGIVPAALTLSAVGFLHRNFQAGNDVGLEISGSRGEEPHLR